MRNVEIRDLGEARASASYRPRDAKAGGAKRRDAGRTRLSLLLVCLAAMAGASLRAQDANAAATDGAGRGAVVPKKLRAHPTIQCIGIKWSVEGDANNNASGTLAFREAGQEEWKKALPLRRTLPRDPNKYVKCSIPWNKWIRDFKRYAGPVFKENYLAGSIFHLKPATKYEVKVTLADPDGGGETRTETVTTRAVPTIPEGGRVIEVKGGGALKSALAQAKPGDIFNVHAGEYDGGIVLATSGTPEKPISIRAAGDGEALIHAGGAKNTTGILVKGSHVRLLGLSFHGFKVCVCVARTAADLAVMGCRLTHFASGIRAHGNDGYYADNVIRESYWKYKDAPGIGFYTHHPHCLGNVVCRNEISLVGDAIVLICGECDVYGNDVIFGNDDALETDEGYANLRIMDNRFSFTGQNGISFQPYIGGPAYLIRNTVIVPKGKECVFKNRYDSENVVLVNNTLVSPDNFPAAIPLRVFARNNLFLTHPATGRCSMRFEKRNLDEKWADLDYNGYGGSGPLVIPAQQYSTFKKGIGSMEEFHKATGQERHGVILADEEVLAQRLGSYEQYKSGQWVFPTAFKTAKGRPHPVFSLKEGSPAIDAGAVVPNVTEDFEGKAPDLGAIESGRPYPRYGPRAGAAPASKPSSRER